MIFVALGYSLEPRPNSRALGTAGSVMTIGHIQWTAAVPRKTSLTGKTRLTSSEVWAAVASKA